MYHKRYVWSASGHDDQRKEPWMNRLLTAIEVARLLRVTPRSLRRWAAAGRIKVIKIGRFVRFHPDDVKVVLSQGVPSDQ